MGKESSTETHEQMQLSSRIEALLFVSAGPVHVSQIAETLNVTPHLVDQALESMQSSYQDRGLRLQRQTEGVRLTTAPELALDIERFLELESTVRLSRAALEVLSIIAYQEPVTRPYIDSIRGVNSDSVLRTLLRYGLIEEAGRSDSPGRPFLYRTTEEFLLQFGLTSLEDLPPLGLEVSPDLLAGPQSAEETQDEEQG
jgi:segregation and condensation protein B